MDVLFTNRGGFASTSMDIRPATDAGRVWFARHFGEFAVSANLRKSGAMEAMASLDLAGLRHSVEEVA